MYELHKSHKNSSKGIYLVNLQHVCESEALLLKHNTGLETKMIQNIPKCSRRRQSLWVTMCSSIEATTLVAPRGRGGGGEREERPP